MAKLKTVPVCLKIFGNVTDNEVVENTKFSTPKTKKTNLDKKIPDATTLIHMNQYNKDKQYLEKKIGDVDKKITDISGLVTTTILNTKIREAEYKIPDLGKYTTTQEFNKLTAEHLTARLKQTNLVGKTDFDNDLTSFNKQITSNKRKHSEVKNKINSLIIKNYNFFLRRISFASNDGSQNICLSTNF